MVPILNTWLERGTVRVKCLVQEHNLMSQARASNPDCLIEVKSTNHEANAPPHNFPMLSRKNWLIPTSQLLLLWYKISYILSSVQRFCWECSSSFGSSFTGSVLQRYILTINFVLFNFIFGWYMYVCKYYESEKKIRTLFNTPKQTSMRNLELFCKRSILAKNL